LDVHAYMAERMTLIDAAIEERFSQATDWPESLRGAMRHLLFPGGKRLRPVFSLAAAEAVGRGAPSSRHAAMPMGVAVEFIHTYSLVHDDLPCMDDDDERRGRPTVHVAFDEATAVLAGDALLTEAFSVLGEGVESASDAQSRIRAVAYLARAAGASGLVGGQIDDLAFFAEGGDAASDEKSGTDRARLASIHARKTAALFQAAIVGGATLGGASESERATLEAFGRDIGTAFQIADDVLDADKQEAASILRIDGISEARAGAEGLLRGALGVIEGWGERAEPLRELAVFAVRRER